jgi:aldehyde dehydrogenase
MINEVNQQILEEIIRRILVEFDGKDSTCGCPLPISPPRSNLHVALYSAKGIDGIFDSIGDAVAAARQSYQNWRMVPLEKRHIIIESIRQVGRNCAAELAEMAQKETGFGRSECKTHKNRLVADKTPGIEFLHPIAYSGDHGLTLIESAPYGLVASITPSTNPTSTIINNAISILSAGNTVVFNVHPRAKNVSLYTIRLLNKTMQAMGAPGNLLCTVSTPTIESAQALMVHPDINLVLVTGGPEVVKVAMKCGKRAICAGPGNPPVVVDETADINKAGRDIINGCSFDNNLVCVDEKEVFVVEGVADRLKSTMLANGAYEVPHDAIGRLENVIFSEPGQPGNPGTMNMKWVGQDACQILREAGFSVDDHVRAVIVDVPSTHSLIWTEQMMPVLPIVRVRNVDEAIDLAVKAEHGFRHSAIVHSLNLPTLSKMARVMDTAIFVKNASAYSGLGFNGEGYTSFSIGTFTGEGLTTCRTFTRDRRCALIDYFRII